MIIELEVHDDTNKPIFKQFIGEGEYDGKPVELCSIIPSGTPVIRFEGKIYTVDIHEIVQAVCAAHLEDEV